MSRVECDELRKPTPSASIVILCWYCPSVGHPKNPIAKFIAEASMRSLQGPSRSVQAQRMEGGKVPNEVVSNEVHHTH